MTKISNLNCIEAFLHCGLCIDEFKAHEHRGKSPETLQNISVGWTKQGFQVWCNRHQVNMLHVDFEGQTHPANSTRKEPKKK